METYPPKFVKIGIYPPKIAEIGKYPPLKIYSRPLRVFLTASLSLGGTLQICPKRNILVMVLNIFSYFSYSRGADS